MRAPFLPKNKDNKPKKAVLLRKSLKELNKSIEEFEHDILSIEFKIEEDYYRAYIEYKQKYE